MFLAIIFLAFGVLAWVAVGVLLYFRKKALGNTDVMRGTETSSASDASGAAPGTLVEVKGTLRCESPLTSEMSEKARAYYHSQVIREYRETDRDADGDLKTRRRTEVVASNEQFAPFAVEDSSGAVGVKAEDAEVDAKEVVNRFEKDRRERARKHHARRLHREPRGRPANHRIPPRREDTPRGCARVRPRPHRGGRRNVRLRGGAVHHKLPLRGATRKEI